MMETQVNAIEDKLLDMNPDPIPRFVLLKEFKKETPDSSEYRSLYEQVCMHRYVKAYEDTQNARGFWEPFHGYTEGTIRKLLSFGLGKEHICLRKISSYLEKVLQNEEDWGQYEKQDNPLWYPNMFMPLVSAAMLSLIDKDHPLLQKQRQQWAYIAQESFVDGKYNGNKNISAIEECFGFTTKRPIPPFNYYCLLLLAPDGNHTYIDAPTDQALVDFCMNEAGGIYYVYNNKPGDMISISTCNRDSRDFWHWIRALSLIAQFNGWAKYKDRYCDFILSQANQDGLWEFPKKFDFALSNSWRNKSKVIDSSIFVARMLNDSRAF